MPQYKRAIYANETATLENNHIRLDVHKRNSGWGWGEVYSPSGKLMGIFEHLGEIMIRDQDIPMRLEACKVKREMGDFGECLCFQVKSVVVQEKLNGTSFANWMRYPFNEYFLDGEVTCNLSLNKPVIYMSYKLRANANVYARYIRGPWLKVGEESFGTKKDDAIFPGVEWLIGDEWSSGTDWFKDPWAMRCVPHPNKVTIPVMAISHDGIALGLSWNPNQLATQWFNYRKHFPQPVFASPNCIDRMNNHLMGLMVPSVESETEENKVYAEPPLELHLDQRIEFDAELFLSEGNSLNAVIDWVKRHGLPEIEPRWSFQETLDRIASAYNTNFWYEGKGFGNEQHPDSIGPRAPSFAERYIRENPDNPIAKELKDKVDWCRQKTGHIPVTKATQNISDEEKENMIRRGMELLSYQPTLIPMAGINQKMTSSWSGISLNPWV